MTLSFCTPNLLEIKSIKNNLSPEENLLRFQVMNEIIDNNSPYIPKTEQEEEKLIVLKKKKYDR